MTGEGRRTSGLANCTVLPANGAAEVQQGLESCQTYTSTPGSLPEQEEEGAID